VKKILQLAACFALAALPAVCGPISLGNWYSFGWVPVNYSNNPLPQAMGGFPGYTGVNGTTILGTTCSGTAPCTDPWTFTAAGSVDLYVSDLFYDGDQFAVYDNGVLLGYTSSPANDGTYCNNDPSLCGSSKFSHGVFILGSGNHSITIFLVGETNGINSGRAAFQLSAVPEPTTLGMMGIGFGALLLGWRFRRNS
jgi:hypothetical protein